MSYFNQETANKFIIANGYKNIKFIDGDGYIFYTSYAKIVKPCKTYIKVNVHGCGERRIKYNNIVDFC